jgi:hypothetical protein
LTPWAFLAASVSLVRQEIMARSPVRVVVMLARGRGSS